MKAIAHESGFGIQKGYRRAAFSGRRTHVVKSTKHWQTRIKLLISRGKGTANPRLDQRLRYGMRDSDSFLWRGSPSYLIHQHQRSGGSKTCGSMWEITRVRGLSAYQVSLHNLPSRLQTYSNSFPCRHRSRVARVENHVSYTNMKLCIQTN